jgi:hypothetical protein
VAAQRRHATVSADPITLGSRSAASSSTPLARPETFSEILSALIPGFGPLGVLHPAVSKEETRRPLGDDSP